MSADQKEWLRPSMLPKLAKCGSYRAGEVGEAANRGTRLDEVFRKLIAKENVSTEGLEADDKEAMRWAEFTARALAGGMDLTSKEEDLRVSVLGLTGTADLACWEGQWSADLKTGQKRGYVEQQAAYALGFMDERFADEWTVYLLFCDLQEVVTLRFTRPEAEKIVRETVANAKGDQPPTLNEYCGWCANKFNCSVRKESLGIAMMPSIEALDKWPSPLLRDFVIRAGTLEDFTERARDLLKGRCIDGEKIPGVSLTSKRGTRKIDGSLLESVPVPSLLKLLGLVSEAKALEVWPAEAGPFPSDKVQEMPGSSFVRVSTPKIAAK